MIKKLLQFLGFIPYEEEKYIEKRKSDFELGNIDGIALEKIPKGYPVFIENLQELKDIKTGPEYGEFAGDRKHILDSEARIKSKKMYNDKEKEKDIKCDTKISNFHSDTLGIGKIQKQEQENKNKDFMQLQNETVNRVKKDLLNK